MKISVIIPTYKPQDYLFECLDCLLLQSFHKNDYEVIIVLNGCDEPYKQTIQEYIQCHSAEMNFRFIHTEVAGVSNARNLGLGQAQGEYIAFVDDDDLLSPDYLSGMYAQAPADVIPSDVVAFCSDDFQQQHRDYLGRAYQKWQKLPPASIFKMHSFMSSACCKLIRREIIADSLFSTRFKRGEDAFFMFTISKSISKIRLSLPTAIYYRRVRANSASRQSFSVRSKFGEFASLQWAYILTFLKSPFSYDWLFFLSRLIATSKRLCIYLCSSVNR